mgnify:CR=1 FL=1
MAADTDAPDAVAALKLDLTIEQLVDWHRLKQLHALFAATVDRDGAAAIAGAAFFRSPIFDANVLRLVKDALVPATTPRWWSDATCAAFAEEALHEVARAAPEINFTSSKLYDTAFWRVDSLARMASLGERTYHLNVGQRWAYLFQHFGRRPNVATHRLLVLKLVP